jgi:hypothetical protein
MRIFATNSRVWDNPTVPSGLMNRESGGMLPALGCTPRSGAGCVGSSASEPGRCPALDP